MEKRYWILIAILVIFLVVVILFFASPTFKYEMLGMISNTQQGGSVGGGGAGV